MLKNAYVTVQLPLPLISSIAEGVIAICGLIAVNAKIIVVDVADAAEVDSVTNAVVVWIVASILTGPVG